MTLPPSLRFALLAHRPARGKEYAPSLRSAVFERTPRAMLAKRALVIARLSKIEPVELGLPVLVIAELLFGAKVQTDSGKRRTRGGA